MDTLRDSPFLKACRREPTPHTPVWLMRQAGRYMKDYRVIREKKGFIELCKDSALAAEVTVHAQEKLKTDAAIIFSDILLLIEPMGLGLDYPKGNGPLIARPVRDSKAVDAVQELVSPEPMEFMLKAVRETRRRLKPHVPLLGFAGAPFTLAAYMVEGGSSKDFTETKKFMKADPARWRALLQKITRATALYMNAQAEAGVQALQLFDSWAGALSPEEYSQFAAPYTRQLVKALPPGVPLIHFGTKTGDFLEEFSRAGGDVISVDHRISLEEAWKKIGPGKAIQGNLDPMLLCGDMKEVRRQTERILKEAAGRPGHIFNLGHGVLPETPEQNAVDLVELVHELSSR